MQFITRLKLLYENGITVPVINGVPGKAVQDKRKALRQGGVGSTDLFAIGIDPLVVYLERRLTGICLVSLPVLGPVNLGETGPLPHLQDRLTLMAYCDDINPAITSLEEFRTADEGARLFELSAGTRLHRDPSTNKCKFLPLGKWKTRLK